MSEKSKELSMLELCQFYQDQNRRIFGERTPPLDHRQPLSSDCSSSSIQPQISLQSTNTGQQRKPHGVKEPTNSIVTKNHVEQRPVWTTLQSPNHHDHPRKAEQIEVRKLPKPLLTRQHDDEGIGVVNRVAMIRRKRYRCLD